MLKIALPDHIGFDSVNDFLSDVVTQMSETKKIELHFSSVKKINSILVALLICIINEVQNQKINLKIMGVSEELFSFLSNNELEKKIKSFCN